MDSTLDRQGFAKLLGLEGPSAIPEVAADLIKKVDFSYKPVTGADRDAVLLDVLHRIHTANLKPSGESRQNDWEQGWGENLQDFIKSNYDIETLVPKYFKPDPVLRLQHQYVRPKDSQFELNFIKVLRSVLAKQYFGNLSNLFEFGCGTGYHLVSLAQQLPKVKICGLDWAQATVQTIELIAKHHHLPLTGRRFDYFEPDNTLEVPKNSGFFTFASLEQVGTQHEKFFQFILEKKPTLCVHVECMDALYEENDLLDFLAICYHRKRNYLSGFLPRLQALEKEGKASIESVKRTHFGNAYHEAYSIIVWRPL